MKPANTLITIVEDGKHRTILAAVDIHGPLYIYDLHGIDPERELRWQIGHTETGEPMAVYRHVNTAIECTHALINAGDWDGTDVARMQRTNKDIATTIIATHHKRDTADAQRAQCHTSGTVPTTVTRSNG